MSFHLKKSDAAVEQGVKRIALSQIDSAIAEIDDEKLDIHATVHQVRKRCKKLRALVRLVRPAFADYKSENGAFREAASKLSYIRDAEALIETYDHLMQTYDDSVERRAFGSIRRRLTLRKKRIAEEKGLDAKLAEFRETMVEARERAQGWTLDDDGFGAIGGGLAKTYRRGKKAIARAREETSAEHLHDFRKRAKYHYYHTNILRAIWPGPLQAHRDAADRLADLLGNHHNLAVFKPTLLNDPDAFATPNQLEAFVGMIEQRQCAIAADAFNIGLRLFAGRLPPCRVGRRFTGGSGKSARPSACSTAPAHPGSSEAEMTPGENALAGRHPRARLLTVADAPRCPA